MAGELELDAVVIRALRMGDLDRLVHIDQAHSGRNRRAWYEGRLRRALAESDVRVSLAAESDRTLVGALMGSVHYGEFGVAEPVAVLDTILVDPAFQGKGIARALFEQLEKNLRGLRVERVRTEVAWDEPTLIGFLGKTGFAPVPRFVLEKKI